MLAPRGCPQALAGARFFTLRECQVGLGYEARAWVLASYPSPTYLLRVKHRAVARAWGHRLHRYMRYLNVQLFLILRLGK